MCFLTYSIGVSVFSTGPGLLVCSMLSVCARVGVPRKLVPVRACDMHHNLRLFSCSYLMMHPSADVRQYQRPFVPVLLLLGSELCLSSSFAIGKFILWRRAAFLVGSGISRHYEEKII